MLQSTRKSPGPASRMRAVASVLTLVASGCAGEIATDHGTGGSGSGGPSGSGPTGSGPIGTEAPSPRLLRQLTLSEYHDTVTDLLQITDPDTTNLPPDVPVRGFTTNVSSAFVDSNNVDHYVSVGTALADRAVRESYAALVPCQTQDTACATTFVEKFGLRAFRRPLDADEKARYLVLFDPAVTGGDFKAGVTLVVKTMLVSPYFLLRS